MADTQNISELLKGVKAAFGDGKMALAIENLSQAAKILESGSVLSPDEAFLWEKFGLHLLEMGEIDQLTNVLDKIAKIHPWPANIHSDMLFNLHHLPDIDQQTIFDAHIKWAKLHAPVEKAATSHCNNPDPARRLKIGYISPDFRLHAVAFFAEPLISAHNRQNVEVFGYANVTKFDLTTDYIKGKFDQYRNICGLDTESLVNLIRSDGIDILVDLAGHTTGNSLPAMAYKPAPIQVSYLGYPGTTGMRQIDYRLVDGIVTPAEQQKFYTEELIELPNPFFCFADNDLPIAPLPAQSSGFITFGSSQNNCKINNQTLSLWAGVLQLQKDSRLVLRFARGDDPQIREFYLRQFEKLGIERTRIEIYGFLPYADYLKQYEKIDIALDTFPFNGHTTICDALSMGVPTISLTGETFASRLGLCILKSVGLEFFSAQTKDEYIKKAVALAQNSKSLAQIRQSTRARMQAGNLCNRKKFADSVEEAYRKMWQKWCLKQNQSGLGIKPEIMEETKKSNIVVESKAKRGILYMIWGDDPKHHATLQQSIDSVKKYHPELPIHVEKLADGGKINKTRICNITPFDETLFLDNDTIVMDRLDFGFEKAGRHGLACVINECPWARRYSDKRLTGDMVEYNSGVLFYTKQAKPLFDTWNKIFPTTDATIRHIVGGKSSLMPVADQGSFALAFQETGFLPFVLPINWNFRAEYYRRFCGPLKIWHSYNKIPQAMFEWNEQQKADDAIMQFMSLDFVN
jgi:protein O-GlcNAc transferase